MNAFRAPDCGLEVFRLEGFKRQAKDGGFGEAEAREKHDEARPVKTAGMQGKAKAWWGGGGKKHLIAAFCVS